MTIKCDPYFGRNVEHKRLYDVYCEELRRYQSNVNIAVFMYESSFEVQFEVPMYDTSTRKVEIIGYCRSHDLRLIELYCQQRTVYDLVQTSLLGVRKVLGERYPVFFYRLVDIGCLAIGDFVCGKETTDHLVRVDNVEFHGLKGMISINDITYMIEDIRKAVFL